MSDASDRIDAARRAAQSSLGGTGSAIPLPSTDPIVTGQAASRLVGEEVGLLANTQREYMMVMGDFTREMKQTVKDLSEAIRGGGGSSGQPSGPGPMGGTGSIPGGGFSGPPGSLFGSEPLRPPEPPPSMPEGGSGSSPEPKPPPMSFSEGREVGGSMSSLKERAFKAGAKATSQRTRAWDNEPVYHEDGTAAFYERDSSGKVTNSIPIQGRTAEAFESAAGQVEAAAAAGSARNNRLTYATGVLSKIGAGEGITSALGGTVARLAGPVGVAVGIGGKAFDTVNEQTEKGAEWRRMYGEDAGRFAISERAQSWGAGVESFFKGQGAGRGRDAFNQASALGLSGERREGAQDFASDMFMKQGMSTETAMGFVEMNAKNANISLQALGEQITQVSEAAVGAGKNSEEAITAFKNTAEALQKTVTNTGGATAISAGISDAVYSKMPTPLKTEGTQQALAGMLSESSVMMIAAQTNQDPLSLMNTIATDSSGQAGLKTIGQGITLIVDQIINGVGLTRAGLSAFLVEQFGDRELTDDEMGQALAMLGAQGYALNVGTIQRTMAAMGLNLSAPDALLYFFSDLRSETSIGGIGEKASGLASMGMGLLSGKTPVGSTPRKLTEAERGQAQMAAASGLGGDSAYSAYKAETGQTLPVVEQLMGVDSDTWKSDTGADGLGGVKFLDGDKEIFLNDVLKDESLIQKLNTGQLPIKGFGNQSLSLSQYADVGGGASSSAPGLSLNVGITDEARRLLTLTGSSEAQRAGMPEGGSFSPSRYGN